MGLGIVSRWIPDDFNIILAWSPEMSKFFMCKFLDLKLNKELNTLEILVSTACRCTSNHFKLYYDIKVHHRLKNGPKHHPHAAQGDEVAAQEGPNSCDLLRADRSMVHTLRMCPPLKESE
ncbi:hypothetical protein GWK47_053318 [Chionoecetes opilio]|uniref:Uncharacterized protein n=1 Tax=Chionoecetes opilio TaxID=41210 RepID=A0A8J5CSB6_CHIOP|nr:hypothetical protein GWK47_053318 [Chionoecetes opilio]